MEVVYKTQNVMYRESISLIAQRIVTSFPQMAFTRQLMHIMNKFQMNMTKAPSVSKNTFVQKSIFVFLFVSFWGEQMLSNSFQVGRMF